MRESVLRSVSVVALFVAGIVPSVWAADAVSLRFGWPDNVALRVERSFERQEIRKPGPAPDRIKSATRFKWTGARSGDGYRVMFSDFAVVREEPEPRSSDALVQLEHVSRAVEPLLPTLVLDDGGQPIDLEGLPALRKQLVAHYESIPGIADDPQGRTMLETLTSEQTLSQRALEDWNRMVQIWHGVDAVVGDVQEVPGGGSEGKIENVFSYSIERRVPCAPSSKNRSCVRLVASQVPRFKDARSAVQALLSFDFVSTLGAPPTASLEVKNIYTTDTDPVSLLPSRYVKEKTWSVSWTDTEGVTHTFGRVDRWTYVFSKVE